MGMTMAQIYDASSQANMSVTASLLNILFFLNFFAENGHYTLMRILLGSAEILPFGTAVLGEAAASYVAEVFFSSMLLAVKMALPILAAELLGELGMGILMKAIPQINAFVINMELKVIIGLILLFLFLTPLSEFLLGAEAGRDGRLRLVGRALEERRGDGAWQTDRKRKKPHQKSGVMSGKKEIYFSVMTQSQWSYCWSASLSSG